MESTSQVLETDAWSTKVDISLEEMDALVKDYVEKRKARTEAERVSTEKYAVMKDAEDKILKALTASGKKSYRVDGLGLFTKVTKEVVSTPKDLLKKEALFDWIKSNYGQEVLTNMLSINHNSLNSFYNQEADKNKTNPLFSIPGIDTPTSVEIASFRTESV